MNDDYFNEIRQRKAEEVGEVLSLKQKLWNIAVEEKKAKKKARKESYSDRLRKHFNGHKDIA